MPVLFLISRLSDNARTRYEEIIGASNDLLREGVKHALWVANPNEGRSWGWIRHEALAYEQHPFGERRLRREEYLQLLWAADVVPIAYDLSRIYSVGACEALAAENVLLSVQQKYEDEGTPALKAFDSSRNELAAVMKIALTNVGTYTKNFWREGLLEMQSIEAHVDEVKDDIMSLVHQEVPHA
jgi:hypothetical protein